VHEALADLHGVAVGGADAGLVVDPGGDEGRAASWSMRLAAIRPAPLSVSAKTDMHEAKTDGRGGPHRSAIAAGGRQWSWERSAT